MLEYQFAKLKVWIACKLLDYFWDVNGCPEDESKFVRYWFDVLSRNCWARFPYNIRADKVKKDLI